MRIFTLLCGLLGVLHPSWSIACCAVSGDGVPAINADQTVILLWDQEQQMEHFIRKANFRSSGDSVGFLVPSPSRPQLEESGNEAFSYLAKVTQPKPTSSKSIIPSCSTASTAPRGYAVTVIEEKTVAGFDTVVLTADSGKALMEWLKEHHYAYTPEVATWAQPYLEKKWYMTAMKIAKSHKDRNDTKVGASALRISFKTDRPLFPYREPDSRRDAKKLGMESRILRIYFVAEARYEANFPSGQPWAANVNWSRPLTAEQRKELLTHLHLSPNAGPAEFWLTEFVDLWRYGIAPGDVYFSRAASQMQVQNNAPIDPVFPGALAIALLRPWSWKRKRRNT